MVLFSLDRSGCCTIHVPFYKLNQSICFLFALRELFNRFYFSYGRQHCLVMYINITVIFVIAYNLSVVPHILMLQQVPVNLRSPQKQYYYNAQYYQLRMLDTFIHIRVPSPCSFIPGEKDLWGLYIIKGNELFNIESHSDLDPTTRNHCS